MGRGSRKKALKRHREERTARTRAAADAMRESVADLTAALQRRRDEARRYGAPTTETPPRWLHTRGHGAAG